VPSVKIVIQRSGFVSRKQWQTTRNGAQGFGKIVVRRERTTQLRKSSLTCRGAAADRVGRRPHGLQDFRVFELALQCQAQRLAR